MDDIAIGHAQGGLSGRPIEWATATSSEIYDEFFACMDALLDGPGRGRANTLAQWAAEYPDAGPDRDALDELRGVR